ncbi:cytochrome c1 [Govanella unica]|uniref:Cytochrome c1 n=1 Tax=Govanella unica TaxID=2975056 RepID=A0A9X3TXG3_9PROT|nr:cytochrome c1 [Govania unica]MDA5193404.1 cytochrome c1 [Govania unica]
MKTMIKTAKLALAVVAAVVVATSAQASGAVKLKDVSWSFEGPFGEYNKAELQRGFQVYKEVCSACHSLHSIAFRNLADLGFSEAEVKAIAKGYEVQDGPDKDGEMFNRAARPSDHIPGPYANEQQGRAANGGSLPPDLSLMAKARANGPAYIYSLLTGYVDAPADFTVLEGMHYNTYFPGHSIAMPPPLSADQVTYADGTKASVEQMSHDLSAFLMWAAEPKLEQRHELGFKVMIFLVLLTVLFYFANRKVWGPVKRGEDI